MPNINNTPTRPQPSRDVFQLSAGNRLLFAQGHKAFADYQEKNGSTIALRGHQSLGISCRVGGVSLAAVAFDGYSENALDLCEAAFANINGVERSKILVVVESPPRVLSGCDESVLVERIASKIAKDAGLELIDSNSSLGARGVIDRALQLGRDRPQPIDAKEILGCIVPSVAHSRNASIPSGMLLGIDKIAELLGERADFIELYKAANKALDFTEKEQRAIGQAIDSAAVRRNMVDQEGLAQSGVLFSTEGLAQILAELPEKRLDVLGFAVCSYAFSGGIDQNKPEPDLLSAFLVCCEAWKAVQVEPRHIHEGTKLMTGYLRGVISENRLAERPQKPEEALKFFREVNRLLQQARVEAVNECVKTIVGRISGGITHVVLVAEKSVAWAFSQGLERSLGNMTDFRERT